MKLLHNYSASFNFYNKKQGFLLFKLVFIILAATSVVILQGCKKLIDVNPPVTSLTDASVYNSEATAISVMTGIYAQMAQTSSYNTQGFMSFNLYGALSADELSLYAGASTTPTSYFKNSLSVNSAGYEYWNVIYPYIFTCNSEIEGLTKSNTLNSAVKAQLLGEAKFMRGFFYFYLTNLYGDVPLSTASDYLVNASLARAPKSQVYDQIIADLKDAENLLSEKYLDANVLSSTISRVRPTKWAAAAMLARVYLYKGDWANAEAESTIVINSNNFSLPTDLNTVFLKNSAEAIWQLQPVNKSGSLFWNTEDAKLFSLNIAPQGVNSTHIAYLSQFLMAAFELNDKRRTNWVSSFTSGPNTYYFPYKYKVATAASSVTEYIMVLRLAEQYLIRAEARARLNNISGSQTDLNIIRNRAGLINTTANDQSSLITAILRERQVELFTELGHRWLDLKRGGTVDAVMSVVTPLKGGTWQTTDQLYPIPLNDIQRNSNLTQNPGYN
jgi:hypothetical protein